MSAPGNFLLDGNCFSGGRMRFKVVVLALVALFATSAIASAQSQTGEIFGKVTDGSGAVLPGVTVTVTGPVLLQPLTAVTSETGTYQFPRIEIGTYAVKFELAGFKTVINQGIRVTVGFSAAVNAQLGISTVQETITVTGESPIVDTKAVGTKQTFTNELLQSITSAATCRDSNPTTCRAAATRRITSGRSMASTSPTCRPRARRPAITTSTR